MQFRESILPGLEAADRVTAILDLAPVQAAVVTRKWSRGQMKRGTPGETEVRLPEWITVKAMSVREIAQSGGRFEVGDLKLGPLRPKFGYGGFTLEELDPSVSDGYDDESTEYFYRVRQTHREGAGYSGHYHLIEIRRDDPLEMWAIVRRHLEPSDIPHEEV
jgi:hypothetical protein